MAEAWWLRRGGCGYTAKAWWLSWDGLKQARLACRTALGEVAERRVCGVRRVVWLARVACSCGLLWGEWRAMGCIACMARLPNCSRVIAVLPASGESAAIFMKADC